MEPWRTSIVDHDEEHIWVHGYELTKLMQQMTFGEMVFLLHRGRTPTKAEGRLLDAILVSGADHGPGAPSCATARLAASGNRGCLSAAIAAGVLAIGNEHGGAGKACMELIAKDVALARSQSIPIAEAARRTVEEAKAQNRRLPGLGHRTHSVDPRTAVLFSMARESNLSGAGVEFMLALQEAAGAIIKPLPVNVDGALAAVLFDLGFPPVFGQTVFIIARVAGLAAEVAEELTREKAMRVHIPVVYDGPPPREIG